MIRDTYRRHARMVVGAATLTVCGVGHLAPVEAGPVREDKILYVAAPMDNKGGFGRGAIGVMNTDGTGQMSLTKTMDWESDPVWSPDGKQIAFVAALMQHAKTSNLYVMDADGSHRQQLTHSPLNTLVHAPDWSPDGSKIAYTVARWRKNPYLNLSQSGLPSFTIHTMAADGTHEAQVGAGANPVWSPHGDQLLFTKGEHTGLWIMNADGTGARSLAPRANGAGSWSPDGKRIAYCVEFFNGSQTAAIFTLDADGSHETQVTKSKEDAPLLPQWSADGTKLFFNYFTSQTPSFELYAMDADGANLKPMTTPNATAVRLLFNGGTTFESPPGLAPPPAAQVVREVAFSPDGKTLGGVVNRRGQRLSEVDLWDATNGQLKRKLTTARPNDMSRVAFAPDGKTVAGAGNIALALWDARTGQIKWQATGAFGQAYSIVFAPDGKTVATAGPDPHPGAGVKPSTSYAVALWDTRTGALKRKLVAPKSQASFDDGVLSVAFSPDGKTLASGYVSGTVNLWDARTGKLLRALTHTKKEHYGGPVFGLAFAPHGAILASSNDVAGGESETESNETCVINLWDTRTGQPLRTWPGLPANVNSLAFSPDGLMLASGGGEFDAPGQIKLWAVPSGKLLRTFGPINADVRSVRFAPDGKTLVDAENVARFWDVHTGKPRGLHLQGLK